jgi:hypothetical protein
MPRRLSSPARQVTRATEPSVGGYVSTESAARRSQRPKSAGVVEAKHTGNGRGPRDAARGTAGALTLVALLATGRASAAVEVSGARLDVVRSPGAEACPTASDLSERLQQRTTGETPPRTGPLYISIQLDAHGADFVATVQVSGTKRGIRSLRGSGPDCEALREALIVALLVLLDEDPNRAERAQPARESPAPRASDDGVTARSVSLWMSIGGAASHGLPLGFSGIAFADLVLRSPQWEASLGGFFAPERDVAFEPGHVSVRAMGGRARGCVTPITSERLRVSGCGVGALAALRGEGEGFTTTESQVRPWWLVGGGPELRFLPLPWLGIGVFGAVLITGHREVFSVRGLGPAYDTDTVVGWLGLDVGAKIW